MTLTSLSTDDGNFLIEDGRITFVGPASALPEQPNDVARVDAAGGTIMPGLIEPHSHPDVCAHFYSWVDVSGFTHSSVEGVEQALRAELARLKDEHNNGDEFPPRTEELKGGRPIAA